MTLRWDSKIFKESQSVSMRFTKLILNMPLLGLSTNPGLCDVLLKKVQHKWFLEYDILLTKLLLPSRGEM